MQKRSAAQFRRAGELFVACMLLAAASPLIFCIALAIKWESPGPAFQIRERVGRDGRRFEMLNFRTTLHRPGQQGVLWQTTRVGNFLRVTRIDAVPQLSNVLRGEMSLAEMTLFD